MLKKKLNGKALLAFTTATAMASMVAATPIFAQTIDQPADTPVSYDNRRIIPDGNGQYGVIVPSAIQFYDGALTKAADLEIVGINGFDLTYWSELDVEVKVASQNGYLLHNDDEDLPYTLTYTGDTKFDSEVTKITEKTLTKHLGVGNELTRSNKIDGSASTFKNWKRCWFVY